MAGSAHSSFLKTILIPLFLAAILYALLALILLPFIRRHRSRYSQYLPMPAAVADLPTSWRTQVSDALYNLFVPSTWGRHRAVVDGSGQHEDDLFDDEEGEGMVGFDPIDERRREALEQRRSMMEEERRLGRDLEEGFKDDSEDEHEDEQRPSLSRHR
ncbi:hypothetical protein CFE70_007832 [Pyrenophora teres f. teres 0-1]|uniref:Uncharacterized protein n=2 Tax=Pyrenophora teres f. teres TaxID=97479 RepID=E3S2L8_PYRTT|nr:hypothetical protein PTT_16561 [Pyrenophora teres f. teres 0-1]KAE8825191.1 hypothetical protein HRS9139_08301 [Pyrenophora teres f. teres]CAA9963521.1 hypothetical protein PTMSG1_06883 [Pyrenophora teres f. maculata]KAE8834283.1 hypothetical protein PTNB85_05616 [Pyrenophora teres f. teres]KAE8844232.1 hypothetical protein HRS9122_05335 [Pyrenophora teres f. teres]